jgi:glycosyltransferase involved in cell wall biosynthesis
MSKRRLKISFVTQFDPLQKENNFVPARFLAESLRVHLGDIVFCGPLQTRINKILILKKKIYEKVFHKNYRIEREAVIGRQYARQIEKKIKESKADIIFSWSTIPVAYLKTNIPVFICIDAAFASIIDFYEEYTDLAAPCIRDGNILEQKAFDLAKLVFLSSEWAAKTIPIAYHVDTKKLKTVSRGANLTNNIEYAAIKNYRQSQIRECCHLLFLASAEGWKRKGGDIACSIVNELNKMNLKTKLIICGDVPLEQPLSGNIQVIPYLRKYIPEEECRLKDLYMDSDFFLLPTRVDFTPNVIAEANMFGTPVIATDITGIPSMVQDGINGFLFSKDDAPTIYAEKIKEVYMNKTAFQQIRDNSRQMYETIMNWENSGKRIAKYIREVL